MSTDTNTSAVVEFVHGPGARGSRPLPPEIAGLLYDLSDRPGTWAVIAHEVFHPDAHEARLRIVELLARRQIDDFEFSVRRGVLYGRRSA